MSDFPWVNDYIFASASLVKEVVAHQVVQQHEMLNLSDHNLVVVTFDLQSNAASLSAKTLMALVPAPRDAITSQPRAAASAPW
jgi:hypothetical protein